MLYKGEVTQAEAIAQQHNLDNPLTSGNGIGVGTLFGVTPEVYSHHIIIRDNKVHDFGGGGIYTFRADYITIENNEVYCNGWYAPHGCSGISMWQNRNSDSSTGYKMVVRDNTVWGNQNLIPFYQKGAITDGNGIIVDDSYNQQCGSTLGPYQGKTLITGNTIYGNGGRAIHVYQSAGVDIVGNRCESNGLTPALLGGGAEIAAVDSSSVAIAQNDVTPDPGKVSIQVQDSTQVVTNANRITTQTGTRVYGTLGQDILQGSASRDTLVGLAGPDILIGRGNRDILIGGKGNDWLISTGHSDVLRGGRGRDCFVFESDNQGLDYLCDFNAQQDSLVFPRKWQTQLISTEETSAGTVVQVGQTQVALLIGQHLTTADLAIAWGIPASLNLMRVGTVERFSLAL